MNPNEDRLIPVDELLANPNPSPSPSPSPNPNPSPTPNQVYRLSCGARERANAACAVSADDLPFVMVEPWIGAASSCTPSALSREAHR